MKAPIPAVMLFLLAAAAHPAHAFTLSDFEAPESVLVDPEDGAYYVSNVNGATGDKDGNGYISKIGPNGKIVIQKFIGGRKEDHPLHAPKGLALLGNRLFVTDIDTVKVFDKRTRKIVAIVDLSGLHATFLNDIATDVFGNLYVSDTLEDRIFLIRPEKGYAVSVFKESADLGGPNGLMVNPHNRNLMVVTWKTGRILEIDPFGNIHVLKKGLEALDGITYDGAGNLYVSSFENGEIHRVAHLGRGSLTTFVTGLLTPADISYDYKKNELLVPSFRGGRIATLPRNPDAPSPGKDSPRR